MREKNIGETTKETMKETAKETERATLTFRAPKLIAVIEEVAKDLGVSDGELVRRSVEKGLRDAVNEIQEERVQAAKELLKKAKSGSFPIPSFRKPLFSHGGMFQPA